MIDFLTFKITETSFLTLSIWYYRLFLIKYRIKISIFVTNMLLRLLYLYG